MNHYYINLREDALAQMQLICFLLRDNKDFVVIAGIICIPYLYSAHKNLFAYLADNKIDTCILPSQSVKNVGIMPDEVVDFLLKSS